MQHHQRPGVGVCVIIRNGDRVLLGLRSAGHGAGTWQFPGGHLEFGESIESCALREAREETGLDLVNPQLGPYTNDIFSAEGRHYVTLFVRADYAGGAPEVCEPDKCACWEWFSWEDLPEPLFLPVANLRQLPFHPLAAWLRS
jgi:8-oxo-dGTP diphosphatase